MVVVGVIVLLVAVTVDSRCPSNLDCVLLKREFCAPGSNVCGPCRHLFEETKTGHCVFKALTVVCSLTAVSGLLVAALCWYRLQKEVRLAQEMEYKGNHHHPCKMSAAHMSHYVQQYSSQKKQFKARESSEKKPCQQLSTDSEADIEEFAIYECPGLAPTGEMEVHNPLFDPSRTKQ
ncbi:neural proliferation differentiation and control protein 1-like isoform X2 [Lithobates pipiens]